jgi:hypothetical protein
MRAYPVTVVQTIFGPQIATKICNACNKEKSYDEYYVETFSKKKKTVRYGEQVRNQCIDCWSKYKGSTWMLQYIPSKFDDSI